MAAVDQGPAEYALVQGLFLSANAYISTESRHAAENLQNSACISFNISLDESSDLHALVIPEPVFLPEADTPSATPNEILVGCFGIPCQEDVLKMALEASLPQNRFSHAVQKLELPSLRSDLRQDLKALARTIAETKLHGFFCNPNPLPLEPVNDKMDEGIGLPVSAVHFHDQLARGSEPKELDYSEEDLTYVVESLYDDWTDQDFQGVLNLELEMHCVSIMP